MKKVLIGILLLGASLIYGEDSFNNFKIQCGNSWSKQENGFILNHTKGKFSELTLEAPVSPGRFYCLSFSGRSIQNPQMSKGFRLKLDEKWTYRSYGLGTVLSEYRQYFYSEASKSVLIGFFNNEQANDGSIELSAFNLTVLPPDYQEDNLFMSGQFELDGNIPMEWEQSNPNVELSIVKDAGFICGEKSMRIVQKTEKPFFDVRSTVFPINAKKKYEISFWGKADKQRQIIASADIIPPEGKLNQRTAIRKRFELGTEWKQYQYVIDYHWQDQKEQASEETAMRFSLSDPDNQSGTVFIDDVSIKMLK